MFTNNLQVFDTKVMKGETSVTWRMLASSLDSIIIPKKIEK